MDNLWTVILLVVVSVVASYFLAQVWIPLGFLGWLVALVLVIVYLFRRNRRIQ